MRLMSYLRLHPKTRIYWYRRAVPPRLRNHLPPIPGFDHKPGRTELTKTTGVRGKAEANRIAADIDRQVQIAFDAAEQAVTASQVARAGAESRTEGESVSKILSVAAVPVSPAAALAAFERWKAESIKQAELLIFNGENGILEDEFTIQTDFKYNLQQFSYNPRGNSELWRKIFGFDDALCAALADRGINISSSHPAISRLRPAFAEAWWEVVRAKDRMAWGDWTFGDEVDQPSSAEPLVPTLPQSAQTPNATATPFLSALDAWKSQAAMKPRQVAAYISDISAFAERYPDMMIESIEQTHAQQWIKNLTYSNLSGKTIVRKLSSLRRYWRYMQEQALVPHDRNPFREVRVPKQKSARRMEGGWEPFDPKDVAALWHEAKRRDDIPLADTIRIAAFTGARIESICSATTADIRRDTRLFNALGWVGGVSPECHT